MSGRSSSSYLDRLLGAALLLLIAAFVIHVAVQLLLDVWVPLVVIGGVIAAAQLTLVLRRRERGW